MSAAAMLMAAQAQKKAAKTMIKMQTQENVKEWCSVASARPQCPSNCRPVSWTP
jgi:hypothetical protein